VFCDFFGIALYVFFGFRELGMYVCVGFERRGFVLGPLRWLWVCGGSLVLVPFLFMFFWAIVRGIEDVQKVLCLSSWGL